MEVSYSGMVGMKAPTYTQDLVNSWEYAELYNEALTTQILLPVKIRDTQMKR